MLYDGDKAGIKAAVKAGETALAAGLEPRIARLPEGLDPDDFLREHDAEAMGELLGKAPSWLAFLRALADESGRGREGLERAVKRVLSALAMVEDPIRRELLLDEAAEIFNLRRGLMAAEVDKQIENEARKHARRDRDAAAGASARGAAGASPDPGAAGRNSGPGRNVSGLDRGLLEKKMLAHVLRDERGVAAALMLEMWSERSFSTPEAETLREELAVWQQARAAGEDISPVGFIQSRWHERDDAHRRFVTDLLAGHEEMSGGDHAEEIRGLSDRLEEAERRERAVAALRERGRREDGGRSSA